MDRTGTQAFQDGEKSTGELVALAGKYTLHPTIFLLPGVPCLGQIRKIRKSMVFASVRSKCP